jgi:hypothetical protein
VSEVPLAELPSLSLGFLRRTLGTALADAVLQPVPVAAFQSSV